MRMRTYCLTAVVLASSWVLGATRAAPALRAEAAWIREPSPNPAERQKVPGGTAGAQKSPASGPGRWSANAMAGDEYPLPGPANAAYMNETWPETRLLVWAYPGEGGNRRDGRDPNNWLEYPSLSDYKAGVGGKPATVPVDKNTDIWIPEAKKGYTVFIKGGQIRHATVGRNNQLRMFHGYTSGNIWVKEGGNIEISGASGGKDTFIRNDSKNKINHLGGDWNCTKHKDASVEFIGQFQIADRCFVKSGRMLISGGSIFKAGGPRNHRAPVFPGAELVLLSGSTFGKTANQSMNLDISLGGTLLAGLPERPLTEDCFLGLSYKPRCQSGNYASFATDARADDRALVVLEAGNIQVHSSNPRKARLVIHWHGIVDKEDDEAILAKNGIGHRIDMVILEDIQLNGVMFDHFLKGGIELKNPDMRSSWKNVFYGEHNEGTPDELFKKHEHAGKMGYRL